jgi:ABC-2 type transport system ATP-binding protein
VCDRITILFKGRRMELGAVRDLLQVRDVTQIQAKGMTPAQVGEIQQFINRMGLPDATVTHPTTTLEDLFMRIVKENTPGGISPVGSDYGNGNGAPAAVPVGGSSSTH